MLTPKTYTTEKRLRTPRQIEIVNAAVALIGSKGIGALTTRNLSKALGVTEPIIYRHFENKIAVLAAILSFLEESNRKISESFVKRDGPALRRIEELYMHHFAGFTKTPALTTAIFCDEHYRQEKLLMDCILRIMETTSESIENILRDGKRRHEVRGDIPIEQIAFVIMGTMRFAVTKWRLNHYKTDLVSSGKELFRSLHILFKGEDSEVSANQRQRSTKA